MGKAQWIVLAGIVLVTLAFAGASGFAGAHVNVSIQSEQTVATPTPTTGGVGEPATNGAVSRWVIGGGILLAIAAGILAWLSRARVRAWMIGLSGR